MVLSKLLINKAIKEFPTDSDCGIQPGVPELPWTHPQSMQACWESSPLDPWRKLLGLVSPLLRISSARSSLPGSIWFNRKHIRFFVTSDPYMGGRSVIMLSPVCENVQVSPGRREKQLVGVRINRGRNATERPIQTLGIRMICIPNAARLRLYSGGYVQPSNPHVHVQRDVFAPPSETTWRKTEEDW